MDGRALGWKAAVLIGTLIGVGACAERGPQAPPWPPGDASYDFDDPDAYFELDDDLEEISGLAVMDDGRLAAVQDEDGILYVLDPESGAVIDRRVFGAKGDYEALAFAAGRLYILTSGGTAYRFDGPARERLKADTLELDLPGGCNAEGLRHDEAGDRLLVSCKGDPGASRGDVKTIYAFDRDGLRVSGEPAYVLESDAFTASLDDHPVNEAVRSALSDRLDLSGFAPSDLAFHPLTGDLFVLSSERQAVLSVHRDGSVTGIWKLPGKLLDQPEGLDFLPNGDLFISSEAGNRRRGVLLRYAYRRSPQTSTE